MPNIDKLIEASSRNERLSLLDAYLGYHQIPMAVEDKEKTSFEDVNYCYMMMPFSLKKCRCNILEMVIIVFQAQIDRNLKVYVGDIVVKILKVED